jgi:hypothetical protein
MTVPMARFASDRLWIVGAVASGMEAGRSGPSITEITSRFPPRQVSRSKI